MMDPHRAPATPSFQLAMVPSWDHPSSSPQYSPRDDIVADGDGAHTPRELRYEQLCSMLGQEERDGYRCGDYLRCHAGRPAEGGRKGVDEGCRTSICGWMYRVADHFALDREVVAIALSYIDRLLSTNRCADRRTFKLLSATSLHLAIKTHYPHRWQEVGSLLPDLSRGDFALADLIEMEKEVVHALTWLMNPATAQAIALHILSLLPSPPRASMNSVASLALFFSELSVCDYYFVTSRKSMVAIAAVLNASESAGCSSFDYSCDSYEAPYHSDWHVQIERLLSDVGYRVDWHEVAAARERLWSLYRQSSASEEAASQDYGASPVSTTKTSYGQTSPQFIQEYPSPTTCLDHRLHA